MHKKQKIILWKVGWNRSIRCRVTLQAAAAPRSVAARSAAHTRSVPVEVSVRQQTVEARTHLSVRLTGYRHQIQLLICYPVCTFSLYFVCLFCILYLNSKYFIPYRIKLFFLRTLSEHKQGIPAQSAGRTDIQIVRSQGIKDKE